MNGLSDWMIDYAGAGDDVVDYDDCDAGCDAHGVKGEEPEDEPLHLIQYHPFFSIFSACFYYLMEIGRTKGREEVGARSQ